MGTIKISIVDDDCSFVLSLKRFLDNQEDIEVLSIAHSQEDAIKKISQSPPDVILMDLNIDNNDLDGITLTRELLKDSNIKSKVIMLTGLGTENLVRSSFEVGAVNYIQKSEITRIPDEIRNAMKNQLYPIQLLANAYKKEKTNSVLWSLTKNQLKHIQLIFEGKTRKEISNLLHIEVSTVKKNLTAIYKKLKVESRNDIVAKYDEETVKGLTKQEEE